MTKLFTYDNGDYVLRTSLYCSAIKMSNPRNKNADHMMEIMKRECKPDSFFHAIKSENYYWYNSDGFTKWISKLYKTFTKKDLKIHKGLSIDQHRAYFLWLFLTKDRKTALKILLGYVIRGLFAPSLMENAIMRPQAFILLFSTIYWPFRWLLWLPYILNMKKNLIKPISESTTNKITLLPTMKVLGQQMPSNGYIEEVYNKYFHSGDDGKLMREALIKACQSH